MPSTYQRLHSLLLTVLLLAALPAGIAAQQTAAPARPAISRSKKAADSSASASQPVIASAITDDEQQQPPSQLPSSATPPTQPRVPYDEGRFFKDLLHDEKAIWTSPLHLKQGDAKWLIPLSAATVALFATDQRASNQLGASQARLDVSRDVSRFGSRYATFGAAGAFYLVGRLTHNDRARETGLLGAEALIHSVIVRSAIKLASGRERPNKIQGDGGFLDSGKSFPSGHAITTWALATVVAEEYRDKPLIRFGAYGVAAAVSVSRFTGRNHYPSDVLVGSALGYLIGHYVVRQHGTYDRARPITFITPYLNRNSRTYGLSAILQF